MKTKAIFIIYLVIAITFTISPVEAQQQKACCEITKNDEYCMYTDSVDCDSKGLVSYTACEATSYCQLGTCINDKEGTCSINVGKAQCEKQGYTWDPSMSGDIPECQSGCCRLSNQCSFITQTRCKLQASKYPFVNMEFDEGIGTEQACIDSCQSLEKGACVFPDRSCTFTTRKDCSSQTNQTEVKFHKDTLCSNPKLGTECARQQYTGCLKEDVYWFDSCGNQENIYMADKDFSYNRGFNLDEKRYPKAKINDLKNGNCDYPSESLCRKITKDDSKPEFGEYICGDINCYDVKGDSTIIGNTKKKQAGESWCLYDSTTGWGRDTVGSRHIRGVCINGEEIIEPCKDYREEMCIQNKAGEETIESLPDIPLFDIGDDYIEAACRPNRFEGCADQTTTEDCNDPSKRDCFWVQEAQEGSGQCFPFVSPGLKFWDTSAIDECKKASQLCKVSYARSGVSGRISGESGWKIISQNRFCETPGYIISANTMCVAQSDCGAYYNKLGRATLGGFSSFSTDASKSYKLSKSDLIDYKQVAKPIPKKTDPYGFNLFLSRTAVPLAWLISAGIYYAGATGVLGAFWTGFGYQAITPALEAAFTKKVWAETIKEAATRELSEKLSLKSGESLFVKEAAGKNLLLKSGATFESATIGAGENIVVKGTAKIMTGDGATKVFSKLGEAELKKLGVETSGKNFVVTAGDKGVTIVDGEVAKYVTVESAGGVTGNIAGTEGGKAVINEGAKVATDAAAKGGITWWGVINTLMWIYLAYQLIDIFLADSKTEKFMTECKPWEAPSGGRECEKCNEFIGGCSEYQCHAMGKTCKLINQGTEKETCTSISERDTTSPRISLNPRFKKEYQIIKKYDQSPNGFTFPQPLPAFTPVTIEIETDEPAYCKYDIEHGLKFDDIKFDFGSNLYLYNHSLTFSLPAPDETVELTNDGEFKLYTKCKDSNGNINQRDYYIQFTLDRGTDLTPTKVEHTLIENNALIDADTDSLLAIFYLNEPAACKYYIKNIAYESMPDENKMTCSSSPLDISSLYQGTYECKTILDLEEETSRFYIRCKDLAGNVNAESYIYRLTKTNKLEITSIEPIGSSTEANPILKVTTDNGAESGIAICAYSKTKDLDFSQMPTFLTTNSTTHEQRLTDLKSKQYTYYVTCTDKAGNLAHAQTTFDVLADTQPPKIMQIYKDQISLHIVTNEKATCEYSDLPFNYGSGTQMTGTIDHTAALGQNIYYIICQDYDQNEAKATIYP